MSLLPYYYDIDKPFRLMDRDFIMPHCPSFNSLMHRDLFSPSFWKPWDRTFRSWDVFKPLEDLSDEMRRLGLNEADKITADDEKFQVNVDVQHFSPSEIDVKVVDGQVVIEGKHEEKEDQHGYVSRRFMRRYTLPQGCLPDTVQSKLSSDGVLTVTAPRILPLPSTGERIIPIHHTGPVKKQISHKPSYTD